MRKLKEDRQIAVNTALLPAFSLGGVKDIVRIIREITKLYGVYIKVIESNLTEAHKRWLEYLKQKKNARRQGKNKS